MSLPRFANVVLLSLAACQGATSAVLPEGDRTSPVNAPAADAAEMQTDFGSGEIEMAFGFVQVPAASAVDLEELESREGNTATLIDPDGTSWELSWRFGELDDVYDAMKVRGFELDPGDETGFAARVGTDGEDACLVVTGKDGIVLLQSRPVADADACPLYSEAAPDLASVLAVTVDDPALQNVAWGTSVGTYSSVTAYSNGSTSYVGPYSTYGYQYQCVEYVNRFFVVAKGKSNMRGTGNAKDYCTGRPSGITVYSNGSSTIPATGDFLVSNGGTYGHIAIVRAVTSSSVTVIHQNWSNTSSDNSKTLTMTLSGGKYTVSGFSGSYPVTCWGR